MVVAGQTLLATKHVQEPNLEVVAQLPDIAEARMRTVVWAIATRARAARPVMLSVPTDCAAPVKQGTTPVHHPNLGDAAVAPDIVAAAVTTAGRAIANKHIRVIATSAISGNVRFPRGVGPVDLCIMAP